MKLSMGKVASLDTKPFFIKKGPVGCLLIHGFTGSTTDTIWIGEYLAERNITVSGIQLPGHGTVPQDMINTTWRDWAAAAEQELIAMRGKCAEVFVAGLSMGGALTLYLASRHRLPGAASLAGAALVNDWRVKYLLPLIGGFVKYFPKDEKHEFADLEAEAWHKSYDYIPIPCLKSLMELLGVVRKGLPDVKCPMLVMHSRADQTLDPVNAQYIFDHIASEKKELVWLERSGHPITVDVERPIVFEKVYELIKRESKILSQAG